ncbi:hypothetical protein IWZ00DRAFT_100162 [Phyllosticta capitalensis]
MFRKGLRDKVWRARASSSFPEGTGPLSVVAGGEAPHFGMNTSFRQQPGPLDEPRPPFCGVLHSFLFLQRSLTFDTADANRSGGRMDASDPDSTETKTLSLFSFERRRLSRSATCESFLPATHAKPAHFPHMTAMVRRVAIAKTWRWVLLIQSGAGRLKSRRVSPEGALRSRRQRQSRLSDNLNVDLEKDDARPTDGTKLKRWAAWRYRGPRARVPAMCMVPALDGFEKAGH